MTDPLARLRGGLVASCQPVDDGPMDRPDIVAAMARAAVAGGAAGLRIEGADNLRAVRTAADVPIIGIVKSDRPDTPVRITASTEDVAALVAAGADIVAYDATDRPRHHDRDTVLQAILDSGALAMADCSTLADGGRAKDAGAAILGTTLSGYTAATSGADAPDFGLVQAFRQIGGFVMAEGRFDTPDLCAAAIRSGADAVTVGSSLTRLEVVAARFADAIAAAGQERHLTGYSVDLGGTKTAAARIEHGRIVQHLQRPTLGTLDPDGQLAQMAALLEELGFEAGDPLGVAVTGRVDRSGNWYAVNQSTLTQVDRYPLAERLAATIGAASVLNDAAAATLAEHRLGAGRGHPNFAYITVSTGVGGGLILNGHLHQSPNGLAGHIGFASTPDGSSLCGSGRIGTVESVAGGWAIARAAQSAGHDVPDARAVVEMAGADAGWAAALVQRSAGAVAALAADLAAILGVTRVAIGGSIGLSAGYIDATLSHQKHLPALFRTELVPAQLGASGPLFGALLGRVSGANGRRDRPEAGKEDL